MPYVLRPLTADDLPELSRLLTAGFHTPADAAFAAPDVLAWKFFDPLGPDDGEEPRSFVACDPESGRIVGHVGFCPGRFRGVRLPPEGVRTHHIIDWLAVEAGRGVGATLMQRAHRMTPTQYAFAMSDQGRTVGRRTGYELIAMVPILQRVLRPGFRLRDPAHGRFGRALRAARDLLRNALRPPRRPRVALELRPVAAFGAEVEPILAAYHARAVCFSRDAESLNHLLRYPRGGITGWHLRRDGTLVGFAVLSLLSRPGGVREGRIADCILATDDPDAWHGAMVALTRRLDLQGADLVTAMASTDWTRQALRDAGFAPAYRRDFWVRDRGHAIDRASVFHVAFLEADSAYA